MNVKKIIVIAILFSTMIMFACTFTISLEDEMEFWDIELEGDTHEDPVNTVTVSNYDELEEALTNTHKDGNITILCEDGTYQWPYAYLRVSGANTTIKSISNDPSKVIFRGYGFDRANSILHIEADHFAIKGITLTNAREHGLHIHGELDNGIDHIYVYNCIFKDIRQQMIKGAGSDAGDFCNNGIVKNCQFYYTAGEGIYWYCGGIDVHKGENWLIKGNVFRNIISPETDLAEGAVHFWTNSKNINVIGNKIINCGRGIMLGFDTANQYGAVVKNNFVHVVRDTGIYLCNTHDVEVYNNTVYVDSDYPNAIEYRFSNTSNLIIKNNLTNKSIASRQGANANKSHNVDYASSSWFIDASNGDLHLASNISHVVDKGQNISDVSLDIDGETRDSNDIGADEY